jgi:hypothetical protein
MFGGKNTGKPLDFVRLTGSARERQPLFSTPTGVSRSPWFAPHDRTSLFEFKDGLSAKPVDGDLTQRTLPERAQNAQPLSAAPLLSPSPTSFIK